MARIGIGIDVSKATVDVASSDGAWQAKHEQTQKGLQALVDHAVELAPKRVVLEASGGYERKLLHMLHKSRLHVVLVQPSRARSFAKAIEQLAKTDAIDSRVLARMALVAVDETPTWKPLTSEEEELRALVQRRLQLVQTIDSKRKRKRGASEAALASIERSTLFLKDEKKAMEGQINGLLGNSPTLQSRSKQLEQVVGVGRVTAATLLSNLPELGTLARKQITALAVLAPMNRTRVSSVASASSTAAGFAYATRCIWPPW